MASSRVFLEMLAKKMGIGLEVQDVDADQIQVDITDKRCPRCGSVVLCCYLDKNATDYEYEETYSHVCLNPACEGVDSHDFPCSQEGHSCPMCAAAS